VIDSTGTSFLKPQSFLEQTTVLSLPRTRSDWQVGHFSPVGLLQTANLQSGAAVDKQRVM